MANGINARDRTLDAILRTIFDRLRAVERPKSLHIGTPGGQAGGAGWTIGVDADGNLVAVSDSGTRVVLAAA